MSDGCVFCNITYDIFRIDMETDDGTKYKLPVCGTCWDVIAQIATLKFEARIIALENKVKTLSELLKLEA